MMTTFESNDLIAQLQVEGFQNFKFLVFVQEMFTLLSFEIWGHSDSYASQNVTSRHKTCDNVMLF